MKKSNSILYAVVILLLLSTTLSVAQPQNKTILKDESSWLPQQTSSDEIDQSQLISVEGQFLPVGRFPIPDYYFNIYAAQSFIPGLDILTRIELYVGKNGTTTFPLTIGIRDNLTHGNLAETNVPPEQIVTENFSWVEWDLPDISFTLGTTYYIVAYTVNVTDNWYAWGGNNDRNSYPDGCAWASLDEGGTWTNDSTNEQSTPRPNWCGTPPQTRTNESDMCFITYGYTNQPPDTPDITGTTNGKAGVEYTYTFTVNENDGNDIYIYVDWGDSCPAINWSGPYTPSSSIELTHTFEQKGDYTIGAQAKDIFDMEGPWGYLEISMPNSHTYRITHHLLIKTIMKIRNLFL